MKTISSLVLESSLVIVDGKHKCGVGYDTDYIKLLYPNGSTLLLSVGQINKGEYVGNGNVIITATDDECYTVQCLKTVQLVVPTDSSLVDYDVFDIEFDYDKIYQPPGSVMINTD